MSMNDRIQLDGKMYIPLSAAMETSGMSEASLRSAAASGQLWLRAAGKKVYVELESLRRLMDSQAPVVVQTALEPTPVSADIPSYVAPRPVFTPAREGRISAPPARPVLPNVPASASRKSLALVGVLSAVVLGVSAAALSNMPALGKVFAQIGGQLREFATSQSAAVGATEFGDENTASAPATTSPVYSVPSPQRLVAETESSTSQQPIYYVYNYPVIERIVERERLISGSSVSEELLNKRIQDLNADISARLSSLSSANATQITNVYTTAAVMGRIEHLDGLDLTNPTIHGGSISGVSFSASEISGTVDVGNGGTGISSYSVGDLLYASAADTLSSLGIGTTGQVLMVTGGIPEWGDITGGTTALFATTSDSLAIHPATVSNVFLLGASATTTTGNIFEVSGSSLLRGSLIVHNNVTASRFTATSTTASVLPYASSTALTATNLFSTNFLTLGSSTLQNFTGLNATTTNATSTTLFATSLQATNGLFTNFLGTSGTTTNATSTSFFATTLQATNATTTNFFSTYASTTNATSTNLFSVFSRFTSSIFDTLSATVATITSLTATNLIATNATSTNATSTTFYSSGQTVLAGTGGNVGIGTTSPLRKLSITDTVSTAQTAIAYDGSRYAELRVDSNGDLNIGASGNDTFFNNDNLWVCTGGSFTVNGCPSGTPTGQGNLIVENKIGIGTSTPAYKLTLETQDATTDFLQIASSTAQSIFIVKKDGKVGIGTSTPTTLLSIGGLLTVGASSTGQLATMGTATSTFNGDIKITGKLDVGTIDPVYTIDGVKYATYGSAQVGIKEEVSFKAVLSKWDEKKKMYLYTIDFNTLEKGSDLWLFYQVTDFGKYWENLIVTLTPSFDGRVFYEEAPQKGVLNIYASEQGSVSVRLVANRFDFTKWKNLRPDQEDSFTHFELQSK